MNGGLQNHVPGTFPRRRRKRRLPGLTRLLRAALGWLPVALLAALSFLGGCGTDPTSLLPTEDTLALQPDNRQTELLASNSVSPAAGSIGTVVTVSGQGRLFPKGYARFVFRGNGSTEIEVPQATTSIKVRIPPGTQSGAFGFTIAGRSAGRDTSALIPSDSNDFSAYTVEEPGFTVTTPPIGAIR